MSVEQTTQLIQLILNSVLMSVTCVLLLGRIGARQVAIREQLQGLSRQYANSLEGENDRLWQTRKHIRYLKSHYAIVHYSQVAAHYALLFTLTSILTLAARTLLDVDWLIPIALGVFVIGTVLLLLGISLTLLELHLSHRSLGEELQEIFYPNRFEQRIKPQLRLQLSKVNPALRSSNPRVRPTSRARAV